MLPRQGMDQGNRRQKCVCVWEDLKEEGSEAVETVPGARGHRRAAGRGAFWKGVLG